jgi:hypothetical protein
LWQPSNDSRRHRITASGVYELPFGGGRRFLNQGGALAAVVGNWQVAGTFEHQPGGLLNWGNLFFTGNLDDIKKDNPEVALQPDGTVDASKTWFNIDAGFNRDAAGQPAAFQKRTFPFRIEGVRGYPLWMTNLSFSRSFDLGSRRTVDVRLNAQNIFNRQHFGGPNLTPTSSTFGQVTGISGAVNRFITLVTRFSF